MYKQDVQKLKLFGATLGIDDDEQTKTRKGISDLKFIIIKVLEGKTDEEKCNTFKHMLEDLNFYNEDHESAQADQKKDEKKNGSDDDNNANSDDQGNIFSPILRELNLRTSLLGKGGKPKG